MTYRDEQFINAFREAVAERGEDYVYPAAEIRSDAQGFPEYVEDGMHTETGGCLYQTAEGVPACIVGLALSKIDPDIVPQYKTALSANRVLSDLGFGTVVQRAARAAQVEQDRGQSWGEASRRFEARMARA